MKFIYTGIHVSDLERSISFYTDEMQMSLVFKGEVPETGGKVAWLKSRGSTQVLELNWYPDGYPHGGRSGLDHLAFQVEDVDEVYGKMTLGKEGAMSPFDEGRWRLAYVQDPDGNWLEIGKKRRQRRKDTQRSAAAGGIAPRG